MNAQNLRRMISHQSRPDNSSHANPIEVRATWPKALILFGMLMFLLEQGVQAQVLQDRLGTIFYSPAERALITATRKGGEFATDRNAASVSLTGIVSRSGSKGTAWINGRPIAEGESLTATGVPSLQPGQIMIDGKQVRVRETLELESGTRAGSLPPGAVTVRRGK